MHGQRSLAGYNPWDGKESDTTEHTHARVHSHTDTYTHTHTHTHPNLEEIGAGISTALVSYPWGRHVSPQAFEDNDLSS